MTRHSSPCTRAVARLRRVLWLACTVASGCGGAAPEAASPTRAAAASPATKAPPNDANSLDALKKQLSSPIGDELNLAAKGLGPGLGSLLAESDALGSV